ncbi:MAG: hypothetical protein GX995_02475 [Clostridiales bacterium]|nr:hypothetical protein [Clostridiales bacterium]
MLSEKSKRENVKDESSDELCRCGRTRNSVEVFVMKMERRGSIIHNS